jgi:hypothetical protein
VPRASEVAQMLDTSTASVNRLLLRVRRSRPGWSGTVPTLSCAGTCGSCAVFGDDVMIDKAQTTLLGFALAASLTASVAFHRQLGHQERPEGSHSPWEYGRRSDSQGRSSGVLSTH